MQTQQLIINIVSIQKVSEEPFKLPKGSDLSSPEMIEYDFILILLQLVLKLILREVMQIMDFINKIKNENKSLVIDNSIITKKDGNILTIKSTLSINYTNSDA